MNHIQLLRTFACGDETNHWKSTTSDNVTLLSDTNKTRVGQIITQFHWRRTECPVVVSDNLANGSNNCPCPTDILRLLKKENVCCPIILI